MTTNFAELLQPFVAEKPNHYGIDHQWVMDGWRMATNMRIAIRLRTGEPNHRHVEDDGDVKRVPRMADIFKPHDQAFNEPERFELMAMMSCDACRGSGRLYIDCEKCNGSGRCSCRECECEHDCGRCDGSGEILEHCCKCEDIKTPDGEKIDCKYWYLIQVLPEVRIRHIETMSLFTFSIDGLSGQGIVAHIACP